MQGHSISDFSFAPRLSACPGCGSPELSFWGRSEDTEVAVGGFDQDRCEACGTVFTNPRPAPEALGAFYQRLEGQDDQVSVAASLRFFTDPGRRAARVRDYFDPLLKRRASGKLLDFGCGAGWFVALAREAGFEAEGVEQIPAAAQAARDVLGVPVRVGDETAIPDEPTYDIIVCNNLIEHIVDPAGFAGRVRRALLPGGLWMVNFPSADAEMFKAFGASSYYFMTPYHLTHFTRAGFSGLVNRTGFRTASFETQSEAFYWGRGLAAHLGMAARFEEWRRDPEFIRYDIALDHLLSRLANASGVALNELCFAKV